MKNLFRYLKSAFWVREKIPLLGYVPVNVLALAPLIALGFGHPAFWLIGLAGEAAFLWAMASNQRFRNLVDARAQYADTEAKTAARDSLVAKLLPPNHERLSHLEGQLRQVEDSYEQFAKGDIIAADNLENLRTLDDVYLRLLSAHQHLSSGTEANIAEITQRIAHLQEKIAFSKNEATRESRKATVALLQKRLAILDKREQALEEIDSDLARIEAQFQLAVDSSVIRAKPAEAKLDLDMASRLLTTPEYLDFGSAIDLTDDREVAFE